MDMYQKRKMRQEKKLDGDKKANNKTNINWYIPPLINFPINPYFTIVLR